MNEDSNFIPTRRAAIKLVGALCLAISHPAMAQSYPARPIRIVVSTGAGGISDVAVRLMAEDLGKRLGQPVIVENRPGANGLVAAQAVMGAAADGYTFLCGELPKVSAIFVRNAVDALKDLAPVSRILTGDMFVYASTSSNISSLKDLTAVAKAIPGGLRVPSVATNVHMMMAILANRGGFRFEDIPYRTSPETVQALLNGDGQITLNGAAGFAPHVQSGRLRVIATLSPQRSTVFPDVPTTIEQGLPVSFTFEQALWAPSGTPKDIVSKVSAAMAVVLKDPGLAEKYRKLGVIANPSTPEGLSEKYRADLALNAEAAKLIGFQPE